MLAGALVQWERGRLEPHLAASAATLCVDCGACQAACHLDRPLPALLREARSKLVPPPNLAPLDPIEGRGDVIAIEADDRSLAGALSARLGKPVRRWSTRDRLGVAGREHPSWRERAEAIAAAVGASDVIVADGGVAEALEAAGVKYRWLHEVLPSLPIGTSSCRTKHGDEPPAACCGGAGPLAAHHADDAARVAGFWDHRGGGARVADARCRQHLRRAGIAVTDPLDALLESP
jgi:hypothetical protein